MKTYTFKTTIMCKKYGKSYARQEKAVTTNDALTEYTISSCTIIASNNCPL